VPCVLREILKLWRFARGADHVDALTRGEDVGDLHVLADLVLGGLLGRDPALLELRLRGDVGLRVVAEDALPDVLLAPLAERELEGRVAVGLLGLLLDDRVRAGLEHRDGDRLPAFSEDAGHADLAAEQLDGHVLFSGGGLQGAGI
jgi:hypothetical protein